jgi:hypothetical protein
VYLFWQSEFGNFVYDVMLQLIRKIECKKMFWNRGGLERCWLHVVGNWAESIRLENMQRWLVRTFTHKYSCVHTDVYVCVCTETFTQKHITIQNTHLPTRIYTYINTYIQVQSLTYLLSYVHKYPYYKGPFLFPVNYQFNMSNIW